MSWKKFLIVPNAIRLSRQAPKDVDARWDLYWADVKVTGTHGDVLWDPEEPEEARGYLDELRRRADTSLAVVDAGCGNGRITRMLAAEYPSAVGIDLAPHAISRAEEESRGIDNISFRALDLTTPGVGRRLATELGEVNILVRGVFHTLGREGGTALATNLRAMLGGRGTLLLAETNVSSGLGYLEYLGATSTQMPAPLARAVAAGIPAPAPFGGPQFAQCFPVDQWQVLLSEPTSIATVPMGEPDVPDQIPGFLAVLRARGPGTDASPV
ncbi:MAG: class I SAM-dependent methyltransferase [Nocardioidaceae bacterium]